MPVGHGLLGVKATLQHPDDCTIRLSVRVRNGKTPSKLFPNAHTAYQAHNQERTRGQFMTIGHLSPSCELTRPIRRTPYGLSGATQPGLSGAKARPIRRT